MSFFGRIRKGIGKAIRKVADWISPAPPPPPPTVIEFDIEESSPAEFDAVEEIIRETRRRRRIPSAEPIYVPPSPPPPPARPARHEWKLPFRKQEVIEPEAESELDAVRETILRILSDMKEHLEDNPRFEAVRLESATYAKSGDADFELSAILSDKGREDAEEISEAQLDFEIGLADASRDSLQALGCWVSSGYNLEPDLPGRYPADDDETAEARAADLDRFAYYTRMREYGNNLSQSRSFLETSVGHGRKPTELVLRVYWCPAGKRPKGRKGQE